MEGSVESWRGRWVMNRKLIERRSKRVYIHFLSLLSLLPLPPPLLKPRFHNGDEELAFIFSFLSFSFPVCGEMMRSAFTMAMISFFFSKVLSSILFLKKNCRRKAKKLGRRRWSEDRRRDSKWKDWAAFEKLPRRVHVHVCTYIRVRTDENKLGLFATTLFYITT